MCSNKWIFMVTVILLSLTSYTFALAEAAEKSSDEIYHEFEVQKFPTPLKALDFRVTDLDGHEIQLSYLKGKVVLLSFFTAD
ncbi:MAG: hypothetical protein HY730_06775 [Candidatus Tectomicrobia bacterium]|uniref:Alkyl hydroperoxide reductase subunit C/ Thiol specific antioxidant domain-containing protein n=1 Tax=Tectimicrobiota bacterium TaxID=2528274 RepID=A0A933GMC6_UNCTE|nr:hypothetical protein [Candidatus Tectomicrobia bacterium]